MKHKSEKLYNVHDGFDEYEKKFNVTDFLFIIYFSESLPNLGKVIGVSICNDEKMPELKVNDEIMLITPHGLGVKTFVKAFPMVNFKVPEKHIHFSILLPDDIESFDQFTMGTKVYKI